MSINSKNIKALNQIIKYDLEVRGYSTQTHMLFTYNEQIGDSKKAEYYANKMINSNDDFENRVLKACLVMYYDFFVNDLNSIKKAVAFFEKGKKRFPESQLVFSYFLAKVSIENNYKKKMGDTNLQYCIDNYKQNPYFKEDELENFKNK
jgi:hypothetical protein